METILPPEKICTHCGRNQPLSRFKRRSNTQGFRLSWCRDCINESARLRTKVKRNAILGQVAKYVRLDSPASKVECVIAAACRKVGGVEAFADRIAGALNRKNQTVSVNAALFFFKLALAADRLRDQK